MNSRFSSLCLAALGGVGLFALAAPADAMREGPLRELRCDLMETGRGGRMQTIEAPNLHVLDQTASDQAFAPQIPQGVSGILCGRTNVIPAAWDDKVIGLGLPLFIAEMGSPGRLGVLEIDNGQFRFRFLEGRVQPEEQAMLDQRIREFQARFDAMHRGPAQ